MTPIKNAILLVLLCLVPFLSAAQYVVVDDTYTAQQLVENVLVNSPCANVSNFSVTGDTFSPGEQSYGYFNGISSSFQFAEGVVLSTARAKRSNGPNDNLIDEGSTSWVGDTDLETALDMRGETINATVLEFDFIPLTSQISFDYIFASEEYQGTAPCRYSDAFAFLLKKAGTTDAYQNLAVIPGTDLPVSVTNIRPAIGTSCIAKNETYFGGFNGNNAPINFNGQTVPLTARATVVPGVTYHIKLVIADHINYRYDSAIFLAGGSFKVGTSIGTDRLISTNNPVCAGQTLNLNANEPGTNSYAWFKDNIPQPVPDPTHPELFTVNSPGTYRVEVGLGTSGCLSIGEIVVEYASLPVLANTSMVQCDPDNDGLSSFNLTNADALVKNGATNLGNVTYYENLPDAQVQIRPITNFQNYSSGAKTVYAAVANEYGCYSTASVNLALSNHSVAPQTLEICDEDSAPLDGLYEFRLSDATANLLIGLPPGLVVEYYESEAEAFLYPDNILPNVYQNRIPFSEDIYAKILNGPDCYGLVKIHLIVNTFAPADFEDQIVEICPGERIRLEVPDIYDSYSWSDGTSVVSTDYYADNLPEGIYTLTVTQKTCSATKKFTVQTPEAPKITSIDIKDLSGNNNTVLIHYSGSAVYEFSLDGINYQASPLFENVRADEYNVSVKSRCDMDSREILVLDYPRFFTPNNDGYNDYWTISSLRNQPDYRVSVFDRYGKLLYYFGGNGKGWNGKFNGKNLPADDYWFILTLENGRIAKGHFALKR